MSDNIKHVLSQIARTAVLCGTLGLLLYLALAFATESPVVAPFLPGAFGLAGSVCMLALTGHTLLSAWRTGEFVTRVSVTSRARDPVWFWSLAIWHGAVALGLLALAQYSFNLLIDVLQAADHGSL
jgi:hypothetical protein